MHQDQKHYRFAVLADIHIDLENGRLEMISWKQRAKKDRGRFCSSSGEETQDRLLSLFRCFFYRCFFFTMSFSPVSLIRFSSFSVLVVLLGDDVRSFFLS